MNAFRSFTLSFSVAACVALAVAQQPAPVGETSLTLDIGHGIRFVPPARVTVPVGEMLRLTGPASSGEPVQWLRNGRALAGATTNPLVIRFVTSADAGTYAMSVVNPVALTVPSQALILGVGPTERLVNLSLRGDLAAGAGRSFTAGFVVSGGAGAAKKMLVRAIGPSLALFGVPTPLARPVLRLFDSRGQPYENGYVYLPVVGGLTYEADLADSLARAGAFPTPAGSADAVMLLPFPAGNYTAQVTSADGSAGTVLIEIYEVP
ncbi:MAG: immunoglobulin domain-containing protein [Opitutaceae bacterium]|nr:immunoglobulin domain-containing protein [Opitutaceae bacterium]